MRELLKIYRYAEHHGFQARIVPNSHVEISIPWVRASGTKGTDVVQCRTFQDARDALGY